ncbi:MAG: ribonuclease III [Candidatus Levybacteria bacterium]|nr:ribonuclease III [Candidatus Levybacteria bacterium]
MNLPTFHNQELFVQAFTHRSYLNEAKQEVQSNERLEFLGDSILSFVVSSYLYLTFPQFNEGKLTNLRALLVNTKSLAIVAQKLNFGDYLRLSKGEEESKGRQNQSLLADCYEAFLGALYLDQGIEAVRQFITDSLLPNVEELIKRDAFKDPKSMLQEYVQSKKQNSPLYKVLQEEGPPHAKTFTVGVYANDKLLGEGQGKSKQEAEVNAAIIALTTVKQ